MSHWLKVRSRACDNTSHHIMVFPEITKLKSDNQYKKDVYFFEVNSSSVHRNFQDCEARVKISRFLTQAEYT